MSVRFPLLFPFVEDARIVTQGPLGGGRMNGFNRFCRLHRRLETAAVAWPGAQGLSRPFNPPKRTGELYQSCRLRTLSDFHLADAPRVPPHLWCGLGPCPPRPHNSPPARAATSGFTLSTPLPERQFQGGCQGGPTHHTLHRSGRRRQDAAALLLA